MVKKFADLFSLFDRIPVCDGRTDRQRDRWTDGHLATAKSPLCTASRGKNRDLQPIDRYISETTDDRQIRSRHELSIGTNFDDLKRLSDAILYPYSFSVAPCAEAHE